MITRAAPSRPLRRSASGRAAPLWLAIVLAAVGGMLNALAFPGIGWWPLAFVGTPLILYSLVGRRVGPSLLVGLVAGLVFWGTHIFWITVYLGAAPWVALGGLQAVFFAIGCALIALAWRFGDRALPGPVGQLLVLPLLLAGLWTLREFVTTTWPYGGFSWGRLAFSQSESPFAELAAWVGVAGLSFLIAWVSALVVQAQRVRGATLASSAGPRRILRSILPVGLLVAMLAVPAFPIVTSGSLRVAAVQGDSDAGLFAEYEPGQILEDHLAATEPLYGEDIDLLVWPENASDLDPLRSARASSALDRVTEQAGAPLVVGTITADGDDIYNSLLLWREGNSPADQYDKLHPVPFAEYIPDRDFWFPLAPDLLSLIPRDFSIGTRDNLFDIDGAATAGVAICFDIVDDNLVRQMIAGGADIIIAPTNNADFGRTDESVQQLAIARLRAIETGRSVVNASTVGTSAIIAPNGSTLERLPTFTPGTMLQDVPLSTTTTPATVAGQGIEIAGSVLALLGLIVTGLLARSRRTGGGTSRG